MSQIWFTDEEIREWEEIELQKKKEDRKQYIERGLSINTRHEQWRQMRAAAARNAAAPVARELPAVAGNSEPDYLLDITANSGEAHLGGPDPQGSFISQSPANDFSFKSLSAHRPLGIDACARPEFRPCVEDPEASIIRAQATNGYSNAENTDLPRQSPSRDLSIPQSYPALASLPTQNPKSQSVKMSNCSYPSDEQSQKKNCSTVPPMNHVDKYTHLIAMYSPRSGNWHGLVAKLDSGSRENWIAQEVVDRLRLKVLRGTPKRYMAFNCEEISSTAVVKSTWCAKGDGNTHEHVFRVIEKAPFDVLFGTNLLDSDEIRWFSKEPSSDPVLVLTQKEIDKKEGDEIKCEEEIAKNESAILAKKFATAKRESKIPTTARKTSLKPKDPNKKVEESRRDSKKIG